MQILTLNENEMFGKRPSLSPIPGTFIAGGAIRQWFNPREPASDIDVFARDKESMDKFEESLRGAAVLTDSNRLKSFNSNGILVQCIKIHYYADATALIDTFDFTICQFAWDGITITTTKEAILATMRNHLGIHKLTKELTLDSLRRAFKYQLKGYQPCLGTLKALADSIRILSETDVKSQIEMSPSGGKRFIGID